MTDVVKYSRPMQTATGWSDDAWAVGYDNSSTTERFLMAYAVCVSVAQ